MEVCNAMERLLKRQAEPHRGDDHEKYCKENKLHRTVAIVGREPKCRSIKSIGAKLL